MERATGIEPASEAWEAPVLPLNYARNERMELFYPKLNYLAKTFKRNFYLCSKFCAKIIHIKQTITT